MRSNANPCINCVWNVDEKKEIICQNWPRFGGEKLTFDFLFLSLARRENSKWWANTHTRPDAANDASDMSVARCERVENMRERGRGPQCWSGVGWENMVDCREVERRDGACAQCTTARCQLTEPCCACCCHAASQCCICRGASSINTIIQIRRIHTILNYRLIWSWLSVPVNFCAVSSWNLREFSIFLDESFSSLEMGQTSSCHSSITDEFTVSETSP